MSKYKYYKNQGPHIIDKLLPDDIYGLVQERLNSIGNALELRFSCTNPLIYGHITSASND